MNDIDNHSFGSQTSSWGGIRASLTEMERRLSELQEQLDPRQLQTGVPRPMHAVPGTAVTSFIAPPAGAAAATGFVPAPFGSDPAARQSAEEIVAQARATAREVLVAAEAQVSLVKEQIDRLLQARETLKGSLRTALGECESALQQIESGEAPQHPTADQLLPTARFSMQPPASAAGRIGVESPFAMAAVSPTQPPSVFAGSVSLRVGPLRDISQVDTLEIALLQLPGAEQVEVKEFAGRDAVAVIKLFQPVPLVEELRRVLPFQFEVVEGRADALTLVAVEGDEAGRSGDRVGSLPAAGVE